MPAASEHIGLGQQLEPFFGVFLGQEDRVIADENNIGAGFSTFDQAPPGGAIRQISRFAVLQRFLEVPPKRCVGRLGPMPHDYRDSGSERNASFVRIVPLRMRWWRTRHNHGDPTIEACLQSGSRLLDRGVEEGEWQYEFDPQTRVGRFPPSFGIGRSTVVGRRR
jgi:hypothetical protein